MKSTECRQEEAFARAVLEHCEYATLASVGPDGQPYCVPFSPVLLDDAVYLHGALIGQKMENLRHCEKVCISCVGKTKLRPEKFSTDFESSVVIGRATLLDDPEEKQRVLLAICQKYAASNMKKAEKLIAAALPRTAVVKISIDQITGREKRYPDATE